MLFENIIILGAGGLAREIGFNLVTHYSDLDLIFIDDVTPTKEIILKNKEYKVYKNWEIPKEYVQFIVGISGPNGKRKLVEKALSFNLIPARTFVHPSVLVQDATIGVGGIILANATLTINVTVGDYNTINIASNIGHDSVLGDFVTCSPQSVVSGNCFIGEGTFIGAGAVIKEKTFVAKNTTVGAQAFVNKNIMLSDQTYVGVPAKKIWRIYL